MLATFSDDVAQAVDEAAKAQAIAEAYGQEQRCMVCAGRLAAGAHANGNAVLLRRRSNGRTVIRYAHFDCAPSRIIDVDRLPDEHEPDQDHVPVTWTFVPRKRVSPQVALLWDLDCSPSTCGDPLAALGLLDELRMRRPDDGIRTVTGSACADVGIVYDRDRDELQIVTRGGAERLLVGDPDDSAAHIARAARQRQVLLVAARGLQLHLNSFELVDDVMLHGDCLAARVTFLDPTHKRGGRLRRTALRLTLGKKAVDL